MAITLYDPEEWRRAGRGKELQFFATDAEVHRWLVTLAERRGPIAVWGGRLVPRDGKFERHVFARPVDATESSVQQALDVGAAHFFLSPAELLSLLPTDGAIVTNANEWGSVNGLVLVQHGAERGGKRLASRIAATDRIVSRTSGEIVHLDKRLPLFRELRRMIEQSLCFSSMQVLKDGTQHEDSLQRMTPDAAELASSGYFNRAAGTRLRPKG